MRILVAALLASGACIAPALGGDVNSAVTEFGLIGTWSPDCSKDISQPRATHVDFAAGATSATAQDNNDGAVTTTVYDIVASAMVDSDKIGISLHPVTITRSDGKPPPPNQFENMHLVFQKIGIRIAVIGIQFEGLPEVSRMIFFDKCVK